MRPKYDLPIPAGFSDEETYVSELLHFVASSELLQLLTGGVHILDFFVRQPDMYEWLLDEDWRQWFDQHEREDLLALFTAEDLNVYIRGHYTGYPPPISLVTYISKIRSLSLRRTREESIDPAKSGLSAEEEAAKTALPRDVALGMKIKKVHEVGQFARYISDLTSDLAPPGSGERGITHIVDFGSGQNYLGRALASHLYKKNVIAVESRHENVERAKSIDIQAKIMPKTITWRNKKVWREEQRAAEERARGEVSAKKSPAPEEFGEGLSNSSSETVFKGIPREFDTSANTTTRAPNEPLVVRAKLDDNSPKGNNREGAIQYVEHRLQDGDLSAVIEEAALQSTPRAPSPASVQDANAKIPDGQKSNSLREADARDPQLLVMSLHSCGNLSHHGLRSLTLNPKVKAVAIVGCCYNLVSERLNPPTYKLPFLRPSASPKNDSASQAVRIPGDPHGYPMSSRVCNYPSPTTPGVTGIHLNITARMMAVQAPQNWEPSGSDSFFTRHFYRALLQRVFVDRGVVPDPVGLNGTIKPPETADTEVSEKVLADEGSSKTAEESSKVEYMACGSSTQPIIIGCLRKQLYTSFVTYVRGAVAKLARDPPPGLSKVAQLQRMEGLSDQNIQEYADSYQHRKKHLAIVWTLMAFSAVLVEAVVVVDRWLWLKEQPSVAEAWVEPIWDYKASPRNLVIVGIKRDADRRQVELVSVEERRWNSEAIVAGA